MKNIQYPLLLLILSIAFYSCHKEEIIPAAKAENLHLISKQTLAEQGLEIQLYSPTAELFTGHNRLYIRLKTTESGQTYQEGNLSIRALMDMGEMLHGAPVADFSYNSKEKAFEGAAVFVMPSTAGSWKLEVSFQDKQGQQSFTTDIPVEVVSPDEPRLISFIHNQSSYFISLISPAQPRVGINDFEIVVHQKKGMMDWPAVEDFSFQINPHMPAMDHGSPNNEQPVPIGDGHYKGKVNFTMDGHWKIFLEAEIDGTAVDEELAFDISFSEKANQQ